MQSENQKAMWISLVTIAVIGMFIVIRARQLGPQANTSNADSSLFSPAPDANGNTAGTERVMNYSKEYNFDWNKDKHIATLQKNNKELYHFSLPEKPYEVVIYKPTQTLALITTADKISDPQNLYIYDQKKGLSQVFKGKTSDVSGGTASPILSATILYYYGDDSVNPHTPAAVFSPDGKYFNLSIGDTQTVSNTMFSTLTRQMLGKPDVNGFIGQTDWKPDSTCAAGFFNSQEFGTNFSLFEPNSPQPLKNMDFPVNLSSEELQSSDILWQNQKGCKGVLQITKSDNSSLFFEFDKSANKVASVSGQVNTSDYQKSTAADEELIYETLEGYQQ